MSTKLPCSRCIQALASDPDHYELCEYVEGTKCRYCRRPGKPKCVQIPEPLEDLAKEILAQTTKGSNASAEETSALGWEYRGKFSAYQSQASRNSTAAKVPKAKKVPDEKDEPKLEILSEDEDDKEKIKALIDDSDSDDDKKTINVPGNGINEQQLTNDSTEYDDDTQMLDVSDDYGHRSDEGAINYVDPRLYSYDSTDDEEDVFDVPVETFKYESTDGGEDSNYVDITKYEPPDDEYTDDESIDDECTDDDDSDYVPSSEDDSDDGRITRTKPGSRKTRPRVRAKAPRYSCRVQKTTSTTRGLESRVLELASQGNAVQENARESLFSGRVIAAVHAVLRAVEKALGYF